MTETGQIRRLGADAAETEPFWKTKRLDEMTTDEWESLCDGCGKCCLTKLEDADTGEIHWTSIACRLFDAGLCTDYANRLKRVPDCVRLTPDNVLELSWLPSTCAYRLIGQGQDLYPWHPLISGNPNSVHAVGVSVRGRTTGLETDMADEEAYFDHVLDEEP